jgi:hypothetical protein
MLRTSLKSMVGRWTIRLNAMNYKLNNINSLSGFNPNAFYFAYNNELSKDIGLGYEQLLQCGN